MHSHECAYSKAHIYDLYGLNCDDLVDVMYMDFPGILSRLHRVQLWLEQFQEPLSLGSLVFLNQAGQFGLVLWVYIEPSAKLLNHTADQSNY